MCSFLQLLCVALDLFDSARCHDMVTHVKQLEYVVLMDCKLSVACITSMAKSLKNLKYLHVKALAKMKNVPKAQLEAATGLKAFWKWYHGSYHGIQGDHRSQFRDEVNIESLLDLTLCPSGSRGGQDVDNEEFERIFDI